MDLEALKSNYISLKQSEAELAEVYEEARKSIEEEIAALEAKFQVAHSELIKTHADVHSQMVNAQNELRTAVVAEYKARIEAADDPKKVKKTLIDGLGVRVSMHVAYEESAAIAWAKEKAPILVRESIDAKKFEAMIESLDKMPAFVAVTPNITAVIKL